MTAYTAPGTDTITIMFNFVCHNAGVQYYKFHTEGILGKSKKREYVIIKKIAAYLLTGYFDMTLAKAGEILHVDHSTICYYKKEVTNWAEFGTKTEKRLLEKVNERFNKNMDK